MRDNKIINSKKITSAFMSLLLIISLSVINNVYAQVPEQDVIIRVGRYQAAVDNLMDQTQIEYPGWTLQPGDAFYDYSIAHIDNISIDYSICKDWTDPDGKVWNYMLVEPFQQDNRNIKMPIKFSDGTYIHNYVRYPQTLVTVNGKVTSSGVARGDVNPAAIDALHTTADQFVENKVLTNVGLEFDRKIYAWSHHQDNNYVIVVMTIKNVGTGWGPNQQVKLDMNTFKFMIDTVKLPTQTIHGFIYGLPKMRPARMINLKILNKNGWIVSSGFKQSDDSLRMLYAYDGQILTYGYDSIGEPNLSEGGVLQNYMGQFLVLVHADKAWNDTTDDVTEPHYTSYSQNWDSGDPKIWSDITCEQQYNWITDPTTIGGPFYQASDVLPILHQVNMDEQGYYVPQNVPLYYPWAHADCGPYDIPPGKSIKFVFAMGVAGLSPEVAFNIGRQWYQGTCTYDGVNYSPLQRPPQATNNDWAKDQWVFTEIDSMRHAANRAKWNYEHNLDIPVPPPPLTWLNIQEQIGGIKLTWSNNAESTPGFEGYRIYRARGASDTTLYNLIATLSKKQGNLSDEYVDRDLQRGADYYYYVTTFGYSNGPDAYKPGEILESGRNYENTFAPSRLVPKAGLAEGKWEDSVRVVPNPYNISARALEFPDTPDKIMFVNLPPVCTIRIFSENGNLIKTIQHTDGKSDEQWETGGQYMLTEDGQKPASGIYIANFQTPDGHSAFRKFVIIR